MAESTYNLWEGLDIPFTRKNEVREYEEVAFESTCVYQVTEPTLTVYRAEGENSGSAVMLLPGGSYDLLAINHEGHELASELATQGITAAVLKYRIPDPRTSTQPESVPLSDTRQALKLLRGMAGTFRFNPRSVGVMGFSAGSHLAAVATLWRSSDNDENPDFAGYMYGVTNLSAENRKWLEEHLYYRKLTEDEVIKNTLLDLVTEDAPPAFVAHACDDDVCKVEESTLFVEALFAQGASVEFHLFPKGGHGFGMGHPEDGTDQWVTLFVNWVKRISVQNTTRQKEL